MSAIFSAIANFFGSVLSTVFNAIVSIFEVVGTFLLENILEPVLAFFGITDQTIVATDVQVCRVFEDSNLYEDTLIEAVLDKSKNSGDSKAFLGTFCRRGDSQFKRYLNYGQSTYTDALPEAEIEAISVDGQSILNYVSNTYHGGTTLYDTEIVYRVPWDEEYIFWYLQWKSGLGFDMATRCLRIWGSTMETHQFYRYSSYYFDSGSNHFIVNYVGCSSYVVRRRRIETRTVTSQSGSTVYYNYTRSEYDYYYAEDDSIYHTVLTVFENQTGSSSTSSSSYTDRIDEIVSTTRYNLSLGSYASAVPNHNGEVKCVVWYSILNDKPNEIMILDPDSSDLQALLEASSKCIGFDMYPVVMLRNWYFDVTEYNVSQKYGEYWRPESITQSRCDQTYDIMDKMGISLDDLIDAYTDNSDIQYIQDAFFLVAVSPSIQEPIISRTLYEVFEFVYDTMPYAANSDNNYACSFKEAPYNSSVMWIARPPKYTTGVIGAVGDATHSNGQRSVSTYDYSTFNFVGTYDYNYGYPLYRTPYMISVQKRVVAYYTDTGEEIYQSTKEEIADDGRIVMNRLLISEEGSTSYFDIIRFESQTYADELADYKYDGKDVFWYWSWVQGSIVQIGFMTTSEPLNSGVFTDPHPEITEMIRAFLYWYVENETYIGSTYLFATSAREYTHDITLEQKTEVLEELVINYQESVNTYKTITCASVKAMSVIRWNTDNGMTTKYVWEEAMLIPLAVDVVNNLGILERTKLLEYSTYLVFYAYQETHLEWYQTSAFATFLNIIGWVITVVITVVSWGTAGGASLSISTLLTDMLTNLAISAAVYIGLGLVQTYIDDTTLKMFLSAAVMIGGLYAGGAFDSFTFKTALQLANIAIESTKIFLNDLNEKLFSDMKEFQGKYEDRLEEYNNIMDEINKGIDVSVIVDINAGTAYSTGYNGDMINSFLYSPTSYFDIIYNGYTDFSTLYDGIYDEVSKCIDYKKRLGILSNESSEGD